MEHLGQFGLIALVLASPCFAESPTRAQVDEIVVTATRTPQQLSEVLGDVTVITRQEIAAAGQSTLVELLQARGNLEIASNGGMGQPSSVFIRGANANHTLILVDGMRINSATAGTTALENLPVEQIERIEILRGPASSLYGTDAVGGVIQIFTRNGKGAPHFNADLGTGSYHTQIGSAGFSGAIDNATFALQFGRTQSAGFSATNQNVPFGQFNPDRDGYTNTNANGKFGYLFNPGNEIGVIALHSDGRTHFDAGRDTDDVNRQKLSAYSISSRNQVTSGWQSQLRWSKSTDDSTVTGAFPGVFHTDQRQATWQNDFAVGSGKITAGIEQINQDVTGTTQYTVANRTTRSVFAGFTGSYGPHALQLNARNDRDDQFGRRNTGLVSYGYQFQPAWRTVASIGSAFKAPTFNDLYFPSEFGYSGNSNLRPERSRTAEAGLHYDQATDHFSMFYFDNRIRDLISLASDFSTVVNLQDARVRGLEMKYSGQIAGLAMHAALTFQNPINQSADQLLPRRARQHADLGIDRKIGDWQVGAETLLSARRYDGLPNIADNRLGGYVLLNLTVAYPLAKAWLLRARFNNVFDRQYEFARGYNTPGRNAFVNVAYQFD